MSENPAVSVAKEICKSVGKDRGRMMDIVLGVQSRLGCVPAEAMDVIAAETGAPRVDVDGVVSFYAFLSKQPKGKIVLRLCNDIVDMMKGAKEVGRALEAELGVGFGQTTADGKFTLEWTPCIGLSDQAPAMLVNEVPVTNLTPESARKVVRELKAVGDPKKLVKNLGDGRNADPLVGSMVENNLRKKGEVVFGDYAEGEGLKRALAMSPTEVIRDVKTARLRGRGGAGFPAGIKWEFTRKADGEKKYVICNADEGEPGTFKDRVILTERADLMLEGMTIAGYAIGSDEGILYLRAEYAYLRPLLEDALSKRRASGLLGKSVAGKPGFDFDIRIQMGAGAYVCGEESSLISSCEGDRGDPKNRPPFPAQKGYLGCPTSVNNVETYCCATRVLEKGPGWFAQMGSQGSPGTKVISISGDCANPGVYEVPFGTGLSALLDMAGAEDSVAVNVGGPSGLILSPSGCERKICYDDLATGGSVIVFNQSRDLLEVVHAFMDFFVEESCGYCTPCRAGNALMKERLDRIIAGDGVVEDLDYLVSLGNTVKAASRCGLGQTSPNPVLSTIKNFRQVYEARLKKPTDKLHPAFDLAKAVAEAETIAGHGSVIVAHAAPRAHSGMSEGQSRLEAR